MTNPDELNDGVSGLGDLPLQPTGSGVADLEIAYEQMKVAEGADPAAERAGSDATGSSEFTGAGEAESEAHPS